MTRAPVRPAGIQEHLTQSTSFHFLERVFPNTVPSSHLIGLQEAVFALPRWGWTLNFLGSLAFTSRQNVHAELLMSNISMCLKT